MAPGHQKESIKGFDSLCVCECLSLYVGHIRECSPACVCMRASGQAKDPISHNCFPSLLSLGEAGHRDCKHNVNLGINVIEWCVLSLLHPGGWV